MTAYPDLDSPPRTHGGDSRSMVRDYAAQRRRREAALPALLIAGSAVWLAAVMTRDTRIARRLHLDRPLAHLRSATNAATARLSDAGDQLRGQADELRSTAAERWSQLGDKAVELGDAVEQQAHRAKRRYDATVAGEPLVVAAIGIAIGAGLAILWPATAVERRLFGATTTRLKEEAKARLDAVGAAAASALAEAKGELHRQTAPDVGNAGLAEKVGAVLQAGADATTDTLSKPARRKRGAQPTSDPA